MKVRGLLSALPLLAACSNWADQVAGPSAPLLPAQGAVVAAANAQDLRDRYIVVFRDDVQNPFAVTDQLARQFGATVHYRYAYAVKGFAATLPAAAVNGLRNNPNVSYIEPDGIVTIVGSGNDATVSSWGLDRIDQRDLPRDNRYNWNQDGGGVRAYILDTGIRFSHNDFGGRAAPGADFIGDGQNGNDCNGHGTHVAGTVGGGEYGVARATTLVSVRVLNCQGSGTWSGVIAGVDWVRNNHVKPAVANMSLGGGLSSTLNTAVSNAINAGVTFVVAAGNSNANACNYSPAAVPAALTVGATTSSDARASYSNVGSCLDLFAPGSNITSSWYTSNTASASLNGTSMASPHVAGVVAAYLSSNPGASTTTVASAIITNSTTGKVTSAGSNSPNRLLYSLFMPASGDPPPGGNASPTASFTFSCTDLTCSFNGTGSSDSDGSVQGWSWNFGDGTSGSGATVNKTYESGGTRTVTLTVTDDDNATGSTTKSVTVSAPSSGMTLSTRGYKVKGNKRADLTWSGATAAIDIYRNDVRIVQGTANDEFHTDPIGGKGGGTYTYRVCLTGTQTCSNDSTVTF